MLKTVWKRCTYRKRRCYVYKENESISYCSNNFVDERNRRSASCINHGNFTVPIYAGIRAVNLPIGAFDRETNNSHGISEELLASHDCIGCTCRVFQRDEKSREFCEFENFTLWRATSYRTCTYSRCPSPDSVVDAGQAAFSSPADQATTFYRSPKSLLRRREGRAQLGRRWCRCNLRLRRSTTPPDPLHRRARPSRSCLSFPSSSPALFRELATPHVAWPALAKTISFCGKVE